MRSKKIGQSITKNNKNYMTRKDLIELAGDEYKKIIYLASESSEMGFPKQSVSLTSCKYYPRKELMEWWEKSGVKNLPRGYRPSIPRLENGISTLDNVMAQKYIRGSPMANI